MEIINDVWKTRSWKPTVDIRLLEPGYKKYLDYKYELAQFRKMMLTRGDKRSTTLGTFPKNTSTSTPPASPGVLNEDEESIMSPYKATDQTEMEDESNLANDIEAKYEILRKIRAELYDHLKELEIDDQDMNYITDMPLQLLLATVMHSFRHGLLDVDKTNDELN